MPILNSPASKHKKEFAFTITYECNWNCPYCSVRNKHDFKANVSREDVLAKIDMIPNGSVVSMFGGEPGLVSRNLLEEYITKLEAKDCELYLETNGLFIQRHPDLLPRFKEVLYHCSEDLQLDDEILRPPTSNIRYMIIVHDKNIQRLEKFLKKYNDLTFDLIEATYPYPEEMDGPRLSKENKNHILARFGSKITKDSFKRLLYGKNFDEITFLT